MSTPPSPTKPRPLPLTPGYLTVWAVLAALALAYLAVLAVKPDLADRLIPGPSFGSPEDNRGQRALSKALAELKDLRQTMGLFERELTDLRKTLTAGATREAALSDRVAAVEAALKALSTGDAARIAAPARLGEGTAATSGPRVQGYVEERPTKNLREGRPAEPPRVAANITPQPHVQPPAKPATGSPVGIEVASGPSLDAVRLSWQLLQDSHKSTVRNLEPRVVEVPGDPSSWRLIAGPVASDAEAEKLCLRLRQRRIACSVQPLTGKPL